MATAVENPPAEVVPEKATGATTPAPASTPAVPAPAVTAPEPKSLLADAKPAEVPAVEKKPDAAPTEWKLEIPKDSGLTADHLKTVEIFARAEGMTAAQAQKLIDRDAQAQASVVKARHDSLVKANDTWKAESQTKFGAKLPEVVDNVQRALRTYDKTGAVTKLLKDTAMGSNPDVLEFLAQFGVGSREDVPAGGNTSAPKQRDPVKAFYGDDHTKPRTNR